MYIIAKFPRDSLVSPTASCQGQFYVGVGAPAPDSLVAPPDSKADRSYVISVSEVSKCSKIRIFLGLCPVPR